MREEVNQSRHNACLSGSGYRAGTGKRDLPPIIQHSGDMFDYTAGDLRRYGETVLSKLRVRTISHAMSICH